MRVPNIWEGVYVCVRVFPTMRIANDEQQHHTYPGFHPMPCVLHHILLRASRHHCRTHPPTTCTVAPGTPPLFFHCHTVHFAPLSPPTSSEKHPQARVSLWVRVWVHHRSLCGERESERWYVAIVPAPRHIRIHTQKHKHTRTCQ